MGRSAGSAPQAGERNDQDIRPRGYNGGASMHDGEIAARRGEMRNLGDRLYAVVCRDRQLCRARAGSGKKQPPTETALAETGHSGDCTHAVEPRGDHQQQGDTPTGEYPRKWQYRTGCGQREPAVPSRQGRVGEYPGR